MVAACCQSLPQNMVFVGSSGRGGWGGRVGAWLGPVGLRLMMGGRR